MSTFHLRSQGNSRPERAVVVLWALTIVFCVSFTLDLIPLLRGDMPGYDATYDWVWNYGPPRWAWLIPCSLGLALYVAGALHLLNRRDERAYPIRLILWAFVGGALLPLLLMTLEGSPLFLLFTRSASRLTGGYQDASTLITDLSATLRQWPQFMADYRQKVPVGGLALSPPGLAVLYYGVSRLFATVPPVAHTFSALVRPLECQNGDMMRWTDPQMASAWFQMAMPLWTALCVAPLYRLGALIFNRQTARWAVVVWPLLPTLNLFSPRFNTIYPLITLALMLLLWRGLDRKNLWLILLAGVVVSVAAFLNLTLVPLGLLAGLTILGHWLLTFPTQRTGILPLIRNTAIFGLGSASVWIIYGVLSGVSPLTIITLGMAFNAQIQRPYLPWLAMHPYDMFLFVGLPIAALSIWRLIRTRSMRTPMDVIAAVSGLTLVIMVLSGTARGETGRVWSFFAPLWVLLAADLVQNWRRRQRGAVVWMQALVLLCMAAVLRVNFTTLTVPVTAASADHPAGVAVDAQFVRGSDAVTLVGFDADQSPTTINLHLHWRADSAVSNPYFLSVVPVPPDHAYRQGMTWNPQNWAYPPSCWLPGQEFIDTVSIPLGDKPLPGAWWFSLAVTDFYTKEPMRVSAQNSTQIGVGPIQVSLR